MNQSDSFIYITVSDFSFSFRVDEFNYKFTILEYGKMKIFVENQKLIYENNSYDCELHKWHKITVKTQIIGTSELFFDSNLIASFKQNVNNNDSSYAIIGSRENSPGSTFYVKHSNKFKFQLGQGVLNVEYKGFLSHAPYINAIPRIFEQIIECESQKSFENYYKSLINIFMIKKKNANASKLASYLRQILIIKNEFVEQELIELTFSVLLKNNRIQWDLFRTLFIDYNLWIKLNLKLNLICVKLLNYFEEYPIKPNVLKSLSLIHFFYDLVCFINISSPEIEDLLVYLVKNHQNTISSFAIVLFHSK